MPLSWSCNRELILAECPRVSFEVDHCRSNFSDLVIMCAVAFSSLSALQPGLNCFVSQSSNRFSVEVALDSLAKFSELRKTPYWTRRVVLGFSVVLSQPGNYAGGEEREEIMPAWKKALAQVRAVLQLRARKAPRYVQDLHSVAILRTWSAAQHVRQLQARPSLYSVRESSMRARNERASAGPRRGFSDAV